MKVCEIDELDLPPMNDEEWLILDQPRPNPILKDVVPRWMDLEPSNLDGSVNEDDPFTSCIDPQLLTWEYNQPYQPPRTPDPAPQYVGSGLHQPSSTPETAPSYGDGLLPLEYHTKRADWHRAAEQFHRDQARDLAAIVQLFDSPGSVSQQPIQGMSGKSNRKFASNGGALERSPTRNVSGSVSQQPIQGMSGKSNREFASNGGAVERSPTRNMSAKVDKGGLQIRQYQPSRLSTKGRVQKMVAPSPTGLHTGINVSNNRPTRPLLWNINTPATFRAKPPTPYTRPMYHTPNRRQSGFATQWTEPPPGHVNHTDDKIRKRRISSKISTKARHV